MPTILYVLFALSFFPILLSMAGGVMRVRQFGRLDNHYPRLQQAEMRGLGARVNAAQANAWEALVIFTLVVVIAHASGLPLALADVPALLFLVLRVIYALCYLANWAWPRSAAFALGMMCCLYIVYLSATHGR